MEPTFQVWLYRLLDIQLLLLHHCVTSPLSTPVLLQSPLLASLNPEVAEAGTVKLAAEMVDVRCVTHALPRDLSFYGRLPKVSCIVPVFQNYFELLLDFQVLHLRP